MIHFWLVFPWLIKCQTTMCIIVILIMLYLRKLKKIVKYFSRSHTNIPILIFLNFLEQNIKKSTKTISTIVLDFSQEVVFVSVLFV